MIKTELKNKFMLIAIVFVLTAIMAFVFAPSEVAFAAEENWADYADTSWYDDAIDADEYETNFEIGSAAELAGLAKLVNDYTDNFEDKTITLTDNIDLSSRLWTPMGYEWDSFSGTFDGAAHTISGMNIKSGDGFFCSIDSDAVVKNVGFTGNNITVSNSSNFGVIVGLNYGGVIANCYNEVAVTATGCNNVGGIVGQNSGDIINCYNVGNITNTDGQCVSGIVGYHDSKSVFNCYNTGDITGNNCDAGGVVGGNFNGYGEISYCYNTGGITSTKYAGGVASHSDGEISYCFNKGVVSGKSYVGGVISNNDGILTNCYNEGVVDAPNSINSGGVAGRNSGKVLNCYNTKNVTGSKNDDDGGVGGVVGFNRSNSGDSIIANCYNTGDVTGYDDVGGVVGLNYYDTTMVANCYNAGNVTGNVNAGGVAGKNYSYINNCYALSGIKAGDIVGYNDAELTNVATFNGFDAMTGLVGEYAGLNLLDALNKYVTNSGEGKLKTWVKNESSGALVVFNVVPDVAEYVDGDITYKIDSDGFSKAVNAGKNTAGKDVVVGDEGILGWYSLYQVGTDGNLSLTDGGDILEHNELLKGRSYYLAEDVAATINIQDIVDVNLTLNGHVINAYGSYSIINIDDRDTLNLYDAEKAENSDGGKITGANATYGGVNNKGIFNMYGGSITGNRATNYKGGGGVYVGNECTFNMYGGSIIGNTASSNGGGGVYSNGTFNVSGTPVIKGNLGGSSASNVYLASGKTITINDTLSSGAEIGVTMADGSGVFANGVSTDLSGKFTSDNGALGVKYANNTLSLGYDSNVEVVGTDIFANGDEILIVDGGSGNSKIYFGYKSGDYTEPSSYALTYTGNSMDITPLNSYASNATAYDLSDYTIYGGSLIDYTGDTRVTITGGTIDSAYGGCVDTKNVTGTANLVIDLAADLNVGGKLGTTTNPITSFAANSNKVNFEGTGKNTVAYIAGVATDYSGDFDGGTAASGYVRDDYSFVNEKSGSYSKVVFAIDFADVKATAPDLNYSGSALTAGDITATFTSKAENATAVTIAAADYDASSSWYDENDAVVSSIIDAGTYTKTLVYTGSGEFHGITDATFAVSAVAVDVVWTAETSYTYSGSELTKPTAKATINNTDVTLVVSAGDDSNGDAIVFKNAGDYTFTATLPTGYENYSLNTATNTCDVTVAPLDITGAVITLGDALTYTGEEQTQTVASVVIGGVTLDEADYTVSDNVKTTVGATDYTLTVTANEDTNFTGSETKDWNIAKATATVAVDSISSIVYDGNGVSCGINGSANDITYSITGDVSGEVAGKIVVKWYDSSDAELTSAPVDAGDYKIGVSTTASDNFDAIAEVTETFTISPKEVTVDWTVGTYTYTGSVITEGLPTAKYTTAGGTATDLVVTLEASKTFQDVADYDFTASFDTANDAGYANYVLKTAYATGEDTTANNLATRTVAIAEKTASVVFTGSNSVVFDNEAISVTEFDETDTVEHDITYTTDGDGAVSHEFFAYDEENAVYGTTAITAPTEIGKYKVVVTVADGANYKGTTGELEFTIVAKPSSGGGFTSSLKVDNKAPIITVDGRVVTVTDSSLHIVTVNGEDIVVDGDTVVIDMTDYADGEYEVFAKDVYGRKATETLTIVSEEEVVIPGTPIVPVEQLGDNEDTDDGHDHAVCWLCGACPMLFGICIWIWLAVIVIAVVIVLIKCKKKKNN